ncbi:MAG: OmpA family protein [Rikenellaceae bacterium]|nr:OmpA family protein [Rikenellaceae bacterium]MCL2692214.1 OmpA family protein [Rikenellaceae bacterium]
MAKIYEQLKSLICEESISKAAKELGESHKQIVETLQKVVPMLLTGAMNFGNHKSVQDAITEAHSANVLSKVPTIFSGHDMASEKIGSKFVAGLFEKKEVTLQNLVAEDEIMSKANSHKLIDRIAAVVAGVLAVHRADHSACNDLLAEQHALLAAVPKEYKEKLGIKEMKECACHCAAPTAVPHHAATHQAVHHTPPPPPKKKKGMGWLWWLLALLLIGLLLWWLLCRGCKEHCEERRVAVVEQVVTPPPAPVNNTYTLTMPDTGQTLVVTRGSVMDRMIAFLQSDEYKNATDAELNNHWFEFEKLDFEFGSATEFVEGSDQHVSDLVFLLHYFPDARMRIGGNADHRGTEQFNMAISQRRAETIKQRLVAGGVAAARITIEGFGETHAMIPATATNAERARDRDIAMRFVK